MSANSNGTDTVRITVDGRQADQALRNLATRLFNDRDLRADAVFSMAGPPPSPDSMGDTASTIEAVVTGVSAVAQLVAAVFTWHAARREGNRGTEGPGEVIRVEFNGSHVIIGPAPEPQRREDDERQGDDERREDDGI